MSFYEDRHQLRTANYPETMAALFNLAFNLIRLCRRPCLFAIGSKNDGRSDQLTAAIDNLSQLVCAEAVDDEMRRFRYQRLSQVTPSPSSSPGSYMRVVTGNEASYRVKVSTAVASSFTSKCRRILPFLTRQDGEDERRSRILVRKRLYVSTYCSPATVS